MKNPLDKGQYERRRHLLENNVIEIKQTISNVINDLVIKLREREEELMSSIEENYNIQMGQAQIEEDRLRGHMNEINSIFQQSNWFLNQ